MESAEWLAEHKGEYVKTVGYVWACGDDCNCTEAQVQDIFRNKTDPRFIVRVTTWSGEFHCGEWRDDEELYAEDELAEYRRQMRESDPEREASIEWQVAAAV